MPFFVGYFRQDTTYCDSKRIVALRQLRSPFAFWFDSVTSIPWSYFDLETYLV